MHFHDYLNKRKNMLQNLIQLAEKALEDVPEGTLRISHYRGKPKYYYRKKTSDRSGKYLRKSESSLVQRLAQKEFDQETLANAKAELTAINFYMHHYPDIPADKLYENYSPERQSLIKPFIEPDKSFVERWLNEPYIHKSIPSQNSGLLTDRGETVRSKSELIIANLLNKYNIPYRYEAELHLKGLDYIHPDFTTLNVRERKIIYWEHDGMMDNPDYARLAVARIKSYERNGIFPGDRLILSFETSESTLDVRLVEAIIKHYYFA